MFFFTLIYGITFSSTVAFFIKRSLYEVPDDLFYRWYIDFFCYCYLEGENGISSYGKQFL